MFLFYLNNLPSNLNVSLKHITFERFLHCKMFVRERSTYDAKCIEWVYHLYGIVVTNLLFQ